MDNLQDTRSLFDVGTYFVEIRPYPSLSADITEYLAILLACQGLVLYPPKAGHRKPGISISHCKVLLSYIRYKKRKRAYALFLFLASLHQLSLYQQLESLRHVLYRQKLQMRQFFHLFDPVLRDDALRETQSLHLR